MKLAAAALFLTLALAAAPATATRDQIVFAPPHSPLTLSQQPPLEGSADNAAYFEFKDAFNDHFTFKLTDPAKIEHARRVLGGHEKHMTRVFGKVVKDTVGYNPGWNYHLDPASIGFFFHMIEACDSSIKYLSDHLEEAGGHFLPDGVFCPWSCKLTREVTDAFEMNN